MLSKRIQKNNQNLSVIEYQSNKALGKWKHTMLLAMLFCVIPLPDPLSKYILTSSAMLLYKIYDIERQEAISVLDIIITCSIINCFGVGSLRYM